MNYVPYLHRRLSDIAQLKFKLQKLFSFINYSDFDRVQALLLEIEQILRKYER
ncbi:MAG: hypothetical protein KGH61_03050 [Candidatus Micrarchaeota archaeon]|nr:hypothetical protein [Candidatus Micrarchaeota archaeon]MDE1847900.1 hypothetical protein [Candidatus Micrarchaeota archaeon]MDE1864526.1 hypothetical protein [Candidatus Micrarchaeota archaeon]